jgi:periplasmic divalent cation tolerance protein
MSEAHDGFRLVLTTADSAELADRLARALVERRLAACVNIVEPVRSVYRWKGEIVSDEERLLLIKTRVDRLEPVRKAIRELHSYDVPEVLALAVDDGDFHTVEQQVEHLLPAAPERCQLVSPGGDGQHAPLFVVQRDAQADLERSLGGVRHGDLGGDQSTAAGQAVVHGRRHLESHRVEAQSAGRGRLRRQDHVDLELVALGHELGRRGGLFEQGQGRHAAHDQDDQKP